MGSLSQRVTRAVEIGVLAPIGAAAIVHEQLPRLVELGRDRVQQRLMLARTIGEFTVRQGQRELQRRAAARSAPTVTPAAPAIAPPSPPVAQAHDDVPQREVDLPGDVAVVDDAASLPIEGYDHLAASQVIPLFDALDPDAREQIARYELAHRRRRTILGRIDQLRIRP